MLLILLGFILINNPVKLGQIAYNGSLKSHQNNNLKVLTAFAEFL
jgi:hypothetical protein